MTDCAALHALTPDVLRQLNASYPTRYPFLLQSTAKGGSLGRYDILFARPGESLILDGDRRLSGRASRGQRSFLSALDCWFQQDHTKNSDTKTPFTSGWFLYLGYELAAEIEPTLALQRDSALPVAFAARCRAAIVIDHANNDVAVVAENSQRSFMLALQEDVKNLGTGSAPPTSLNLRRFVEEDPNHFIHAVNSAKRHIAAGDVYQANLSRGWHATVDATANQLYNALCDSNPAPFAGIAHWKGSSIVSSSPERLVRVSDRRISTRPIAGTRPRGDDTESDVALSDELFNNQKERAEHVMLVDLERNDLGRVSKPGSVKVDEMMVLESYAHVHHIVSNIRGELRDNVTLGQSIAAVFPGGTITGCPKVRCMEIINTLENSARGAYTGSFGYLTTDGRMDLNILIRTLVKRGDALHFRAGAGIVADSEADAELRETRAKAEGMIRALSNV